MKNVIEIEFKNEKQAKQAREILVESKSDEPTRAKVKVENKKEKLIITITASDFTALRALATTTFRDLKVIIDGFEIVGE